MPWESDQLAGYRQRQRQRQQRDADANKELQFLDAQAPRLWKELESAITAHCKAINREAVAQGGKEVFQDLEYLPGSLRIVRDDGIHLDCFFDPPKHKVWFANSQDASHSRTFWVAAGASEGTPQATWKDVFERTMESDDIAQLLLDEFLKA